MGYEIEFGMKLLYETYIKEFYVFGKVGYNMILSFLELYDDY